LLQEEQLLLLLLQALDARNQGGIRMLHYSPVQGRLGRCSLVVHKTTVAADQLLLLLYCAVLCRSLLEVLPPLSHLCATT
jgi:hypothetical protein